MKRLVFISLLLIIVYGCNDNRCRIDKKLKSDFESKLELIQNFEKGQAVGVTNYINSISYFSKLTGYQSQVKLGGAIGYGDSIKLNEDLAKWNKWYDINKCSITKVQVDSILDN